MESSQAGRTSDRSPDGQRFLMSKNNADQAASMVVVVNWIEDLKRLVPLGK